MISRYNGICWICKQPTSAGMDHYNLETRKSYHAQCAEAQAESMEDQPLEPEALAEKLGFAQIDARGKDEPHAPSADPE